MTTEQLPISFEQASAAAQTEFEQRERWIRALGEAVLAFAQLEWISHWVYRAINGVPPSGRFAACSLWERNQKALDMLEARLTPPGQEHRRAAVDLLATWRTFFGDIALASEPRSQIVHNPLSFDIRRAPDGSVHVASGLELLRDDGKPMNIDEVERHVEQFRRLGAVMLQLRGETAWYLSPDPLADAKE